MKKVKSILIKTLSLTTIAIPTAIAISCGANNSSNGEGVKNPSFKNKVVDGKTKLTKGITKISKNMFEGAIIKDSFKLPSTIIEIEVNAFKNAKVGKEFRLPDGVKKIGAHAFQNVELPVGFKIPLSIEFSDFDETAFSDLITKDNAVFDQWWGGLPIPGSHIKRFKDIYKNDYIDTTILFANKGDERYSVRHHVVVPFKKRARTNFWKANEKWYRHKIGEWTYSTDGGKIPLDYWDWKFRQLKDKDEVSKASMIEQLDTTRQYMEDIKYILNRYGSQNNNVDWNNYFNRDNRRPKHIKINEDKMLYIENLTHSLDGAYLPKGFYVPKQIKRIGSSAFAFAHFNDDFYFESPENIESIGFMYYGNRAWDGNTDWTNIQKNGHGGAFMYSTNLSIDLRKFTQLTNHYFDKISEGSFFLKTAKKLIIPKEMLNYKYDQSAEQHGNLVRPTGMWESTATRDSVFLWEITPESLDRDVDFWNRETIWDGYKPDFKKPYYKNRWFGISHKFNYINRKDNKPFDEDKNRELNANNYLQAMLLDDIDKYFK